MELIKELNDGVWALRGKLEEFARLDEDATKLVVTYIGLGTYHLLCQWLLENIPKMPKNIVGLISALTGRLRLKQGKPRV